MGYMRCLPVDTASCAWRALDVVGTNAEEAEGQKDVRPEA